LRIASGEHPQIAAASAALTVASDDGKTIVTRCPEVPAAEPAALAIDRRSTSRR
jgi:hypothetical protein